MRDAERQHQALIERTLKHLEFALGAIAVFLGGAMLAKAYSARPEVSFGEGLLAIVGVLTIATSATFFFAAATLRGRSRLRWLGQVPLVLACAAIIGWWL